MNIGLAGNQTEITEWQVKGFVSLAKRLKDKYGSITYFIGNAPVCDFELLNAILKFKLASSVIFYPYKGDGNPSYVPNEKSFGPLIVKREKEMTVFERNRDMIAKCKAMIVVPKENYEAKESESWAAVRYCKQMAKTVFIIHTDGKTVRIAGGK